MLWPCSPLQPVPRLSPRAWPSWVFQVFPQPPSCCLGHCPPRSPQGLQEPCTARHASCFPHAIAFVSECPGTSWMFSHSLLQGELWESGVPVLPLLSPSQICVDKCQVLARPLGGWAGPVFSFESHSASLPSSWSACLPNSADTHLLSLPEPS